MGNFIKGDDLVLYVHDGTAYRPIACLTSNTLSETTNIIESQTKCEPGVIAKDVGSRTYELSAEGRYIDTTSVGAEVDKASHDYLRTRQSEKLNWRMSTGLTDTTFYYGVAIISELSNENPAGDDLANFSATFSGDGDIVTVDPLAP